MRASCSGMSVFCDACAQLFGRQDYRHQHALNGLHIAYQSTELRFAARQPGGADILVCRWRMPRCGGEADGKATCGCYGRGVVTVGTGGRTRPRTAAPPRKNHSGPPVGSGATGAITAPRPSRPRVPLQSPAPARQAGGADILVCRWQMPRCGGEADGRATCGRYGRGVVTGRQGAIRGQPLKPPGWSLVGTIRGATCGATKNLTGLKAGQVLYVKRGRRESNPQPPDRQSGTLTN